MRFKYLSTLLTFLGIVLAVFLARLEAFQSFVSTLGQFGYLGAFVAGVLFVSTFTVAPALVIIFELAGNLHPLWVSLIAALGAVCGDWLIFSFIRDRFLEEVKSILDILLPSRRKYFNHLVKNKYFAFFLPVLGALIIASPLPDEAGITLLGISQISRWKFLVISFLLNALGILIAVSLAAS